MTVALCLKPKYIFPKDSKSELLTHKTEVARLKKLCKDVKEQINDRRNDLARNLNEAQQKKRFLGAILT